MFLPRLMFILLVGCMLPARANLGETVEQVIKRYGPPSGYAEASATSPFGRVLFKAAGMELIVFVLNNKEVGARVSKSDHSALTDPERESLMASESSGMKWNPVTSNDPSCLQWVRDDKATVLYDKDKHMLILTSDEMVQALHLPAANPTPKP